MAISTLANAVILPQRFLTLDFHDFSTINRAEERL
jgi:hypothetical protein